MKILPQLIGLQGEQNPNFFIEIKHLMKKIQAPEVAAFRMQCGELKLNL